MGENAPENQKYHEKSIFLFEVNSQAQLFKFLGFVCCSTNGDVKPCPIIEYFYSDPMRILVPACSTYFELPQTHVNYVAAKGLTCSVPKEA